MNEDQPGSHGPTPDTAPVTQPLSNDYDPTTAVTTTLETATITTTTTKATIITPPFTVPAVAKPLPTPALPFQSARASESLYSGIYSASSPFSRAPARSGAAAAASAAALQLQRELDLQHEILGRKPQLAQDIVPKEPINPPTFRDYGATRDWRREQSRDRRDRSREREREREKDRYSRSRYDRSKERDRGRHRDRYSRERSHERDYERDKEYRHERGYRDYRYHGDHSTDRDYKAYRHDRHDRQYRDSKEHERPSHREFDYEEGARVGPRFDNLETEHERPQWKEGDEEGETVSIKGQDQHSREYDFDPERERRRDHESDRNRYRHWDRSRRYDYDDKYGHSHDWDDRDRAPRDRERDRDQEMDIDKTSGIEDLDPYRPSGHHSRDHSFSGYSSGVKPVDDDAPKSLGDKSVSVTSADEITAVPHVESSASELLGSATSVLRPSVAQTTADPLPLEHVAPRLFPDTIASSASGAIEPMGQDPKSVYESTISTASEVLDTTSARPPPPPPPPLPPIPPGVTAAPAAGVVTALFPANGHPPPPPPLHPPVAPLGYALHSAPQSAPPIAPPTAPPLVEPAYSHPTGNAPPPPRRSTADDEYFSSHGPYYRHSRSSHYRESWHGTEGDHRYDRRSHNRWPGHYSSDYDRHSRAPSPRNRDRYDYTYQENGAPRVAGTDTAYTATVHHDPHVVHGDVRRTPPPEVQPPPLYVGPFPAIDPAPQHVPIQPPTPLLKGEDLYERVGQVGEGTYGKVYKARNKQTGEYVALKRIRMETEKDGFPITAMREIKLLQSLNHRHVISLKELMVSKGAVYMVFEYMDHDLTGILAHPQLKFRPEHVKCLMKQLLEGLGFLHHKGVLHRDIKGSNLLVNNQGELKLADFGLARLFQKKTKRDYTNRVITLWYRPPELILGATAYGPEVDMWSAGCIMVELFTRKPIFQGHNEITQLDNIWKVMGTPQKDSWPDISQLPWYELIKHVNSEARPSRFREMFGKIMSPAALELAEALLSLNPDRRPTAVEALTKFTYFTEEEPAACTPEELPKIEGDWHEYESKQRKKAIAKPKQQHSHHPRHPSEGDRADHPEHIKPNDATRVPSSRKHGPSGDMKPAVNTTAALPAPLAPPVPPMAPVGLVVMSGSGNTESAPAIVEQKPDILMSHLPKITETIIPPPAVSPSYLPYSVAPVPPPAISRHVPDTVVPDYRGIPSQVLGQPPPPPPPAPVHPMYADHSTVDQTMKTYAQGPGLIHDAANGAPVSSRYPDHPGTFDQSRLGPIPPQALAAPLAPPSGDVYMLDAHRSTYSNDEHHRGPLLPPHADHPKGYHEGHERPYDYYNRRHYDYGRERDRDRDRDRDRYRDYSRRRGDYRYRDWSRERGRDRGGRDRDRERDRDYDRYRERSGRDYERGRDRERERSYDEDDYYYRERGRERDGDREYADIRGRDRDRDKERERDRDHGAPRGEDDRDFDRVRTVERDREIGVDSRLEGQYQHGRRRDRSEGEYDDEYDRERESDREEDIHRQEFPPAQKKLKMSTDSSSLSPPSTTTSFSSMT
ncbi:kinase subunit of RNA polymerase II carboxy-terminal domain kinase I [Mortierella sp. AM989]|nr:kinase subunit of RNA polymerase II carboxy-terminal domain kinase I [Mortierella sp. AM989]